MAYERRVVFITPVIHHYRERFHDLMRENLRKAGVKYEVISGAPEPAELRKGDLVQPDWTLKVPQYRLKLLNKKISYHPILRMTWGADMVILMQENKHLQNYLFQLTPRRFRPLLGIMGHGRNFQSRRPNSLEERWKRIWAKKVDWWFGYTDQTRNHIEALGFPAEKITIFNNSVNTVELSDQVDSISVARLNDIRISMGLCGKNVGVFVGGIYPDKRIEFLVKAADEIRSRVRDFELVIVGGGPDLALAESLASSRDWIRVTGPKFGIEKVELMMLGHVFMMPGLMGLAILDAGIAGLPIATTSFPWHSPEIAYLQPGTNGLKVDDWENPTAYGRSVASLLNDPESRMLMGKKAREMADNYSIEAMAENFSSGILQALKKNTPDY